MSQSESKTVIQDWTETIPKEKKIGVVAPLYGYFQDLGDEQLNWETLSAFLTKIKTASLKLFLVVPCEVARLDKNVQNVLIGRSKAGGMEVLDLDKYSGYGDYIKDGIEYLLENTDCEYIVITNPWIMLKDNSIDQMAQRLNTGDVDIISGVDLRKLVWGTYNGIPAEQFDTFNFNPPTEIANKHFDFNFWGMTRQHAQVLISRIDTDYKTIFFQQADIWGNAFNIQYNLISSQFLPFYSFDIDFKTVDAKDEFEEDKQHFIDKWGFITETKYE